MDDQKLDYQRDRLTENNNFPIEMKGLYTYGSYYQWRGNIASFWFKKYMVVNFATST